MINGQVPDFEVKEKTLTVDFTGGDYEGAVVKLRLNVPLRTMFDIQLLGVAGKDAEVMQQLGTEVLSEWNIRKDGKELPATAEGLFEMPPDFGMLLLAQWTKAMNVIEGGQGGDSPLGGTSPNGSMSEAQSGVTASA